MVSLRSRNNFVVLNLTVNLVHVVLTMECFSIELCVRGYQAGATLLGYFSLIRSQREVQASLFRLCLSLLSSLLDSLHRS